MSEYKPITGELRTAMVMSGWCENDGTITFSSTPPNIEAEPFLTIAGSRFDQLCDTIDSIHAALEAENERLREQHDNGMVRLPEADDGMPIHVGDVLQHHPRGLKFKVKELIFNGDDWSVSFGDRPSVFNVTAYSHYHPDTWERIIEDATHCDQMLAEYDPDAAADAFDALVARCKALAGDAE